jgi:tRNA1(Val) A37 N6-methylase TrmN6
MLLAWKHPASRFVTVEAQAESLRLFRKSLRFNALEGRFTAIAGDLRSPETWPLDLPPFDLVTGSPPYFPEGTVTQASHPQAVPARIEKRGSVPDYAAAAAPWLAPSGWFVFVYRAGEDRFVASGLDAAGLRLVRKRDVVFREGEGPRITLYAATRQSALSPEAIPLSATPISEAPLVLRTRTGDVGKDYAALRLSMGFPPGDIAGTEGKEGSGTIATC